MSQSGLKHAATEPGQLTNKRDRRRGASGRAAALRRVPSDSDCSGETASLSADSAERVSRQPPTARSGKNRSRRRGSEWEVLEGLKDGQRFEKRPEVFNGYLHKKRKWPLKGWHKRFFVIDGGILVYARSPTDLARGRLHGSVDVGLSVISAKQRRRRIDIDADEFIYHLRAKTPDVFRTWLLVLKAHRLYRQHLLTFGARESVPKIHAPSEEIPPTDTSSRTSLTSAMILSPLTSSYSDVNGSNIYIPVVNQTLQVCSIRPKSKAINNLTMRNSLCSIKCMRRYDNKNIVIDNGKEMGKETNYNTLIERILASRDLESSYDDKIDCNMNKCERNYFNRDYNKQVSSYFLFNKSKIKSNQCCYAMKKSNKSTNVVKYRNSKMEPPLNNPRSRTILAKYKNNTVQKDVATEIIDEENIQKKATNKYRRIAEDLGKLLYEMDNPSEEIKSLISETVKDIYEKNKTDAKAQPVNVLLKNLIEYYLENSKTISQGDLLIKETCVKDVSISSYIVGTSVKEIQYQSDVNKSAETMTETCDVLADRQEKFIQEVETLVNNTMYASFVSNKDISNRTNVHQNNIDDALDTFNEIEEEVHCLDSGTSINTGINQIESKYSINVNDIPSIGESNIKVKRRTKPIKYVKDKIDGKEINLKLKLNAITAEPLKTKQIFAKTDNKYRKNCNETVDVSHIDELKTKMYEKENRFASIHLSKYEVKDITMNGDDESDKICMMIQFEKKHNVNSSSDDTSNTQSDSNSVPFIKRSSLLYISASDNLSDDVHRTEHIPIFYTKSGTRQFSSNTERSSSSFESSKGYMDEETTRQVRNEDNNECYFFSSFYNVPKNTSKKKAFTNKVETRDIAIKNKKIFRDRMKVKATSSYNKQKVIDEIFILLLLENLTLLSKNVPSMYKEINNTYMKLKKRHEDIVKITRKAQTLSVIGQLYNKIPENVEKEILSLSKSDVPIKNIRNDVSRGNNSQEINLIDKYNDTITEDPYILRLAKQSINSYIKSVESNNFEFESKENELDPHVLQYDKEREQSQANFESDEPIQLHTTEAEIENQKDMKEILLKQITALTPKDAITLPIPVELQETNEVKDTYFNLFQMLVTDDRPVQLKSTTSFIDLFSMTSDLKTIYRCTSEPSFCSG